MSLIITEPEFRARLVELLSGMDTEGVEWVTGPGRSGAIAAVYASHFLGVPFVPHKYFAPGRPLIIDTATMSGATLRKAARRLRYHAPIVLAVYREPPRVKFWYEGRYAGLRPPAAEPAGRAAD